ncbi:MAG: hypothetical protein A3C15_00735 [Candidatus Magasanikbacteria bacterium RIFCSPHIGHO2_02_FULL_50_9b]|uniref:Uncharacterized protein n=1 Tax=Candidatus Magasanikbacteria bacterium RIFCSPHIGHO2_02_FULL_50_9b TaxID=1798682 RepID=A0A1F6M8A9_9BACT|nr:MAG: hypothetical protein A3C15_00735 [Candidatus Magasanikbacteria bacterium RIFCSPHIGHO2_02_FULL_50_9b]
MKDRPRFIFVRDQKLALQLHPHKTVIRKYAQGVDYLGYVIFPTHRLLRTRTRRRMFERCNEDNVQSYLGVLSHANAHEYAEHLKNFVWFSKQWTAA